MMKLKDILTEGVKIKPLGPAAPPWLDGWTTYINTFKALTRFKTIINNLSNLEKKMKAACIEMKSRTPGDADADPAAKKEGVLIKPKPDPCQPGNCTEAELITRLTELYKSIEAIEKESKEILPHIEKHNWCKEYKVQKDAYDQA